MTQLPTRFTQHNSVQTAYYDGTRKKTMVPAATPYVLRHLDEVTRFAAISPGERVLEVGCGMGRFTLLLARRGVRVEGLELSPWLLDRLREYNGGAYDIPLYNADVVTFPPELEGRFDAVVGFFMLHHLHDLPASFAAMARLVRPGGRLAFVEPNPYNLLFHLQPLVTPGMSYRAEKGMLHMRRGPVFRAMQGAGLRDLAMARYGFFPPFVTNRRWGAKVESVLERVPLWRPFLPFQLFRGDRP
jgi:SAM-dependent methyltransferase